MFTKREKLIIFTCLQAVPFERLGTICADFGVEAGDTPDEKIHAIHSYFVDLGDAVEQSLVHRSGSLHGKVRARKDTTLRGIKLRRRNG